MLFRSSFVETESFDMSDAEEEQVAEEEDTDAEVDSDDTADDDSMEDDSDDDGDDTLPAARSQDALKNRIVFVKNTKRGVHGAIMEGFAASDAEAVIVYPADDDLNAGILDPMMGLFRGGADIVAPSRFMKGGCMVGCRWLKAALVRTAAFTLHFFAGLPTRDPTNGFRLFSSRVIRQIPVESDSGFAFSIELLVKTHRRGWKITELPSRWYERKKGKSRFKIFQWMPVYLRWYAYAFATAWAGKKQA